MCRVQVPRSECVINTKTDVMIPPTSMRTGPKILSKTLRTCYLTAAVEIDHMNEFGCVQKDKMGCLLISTHLSPSIAQQFLSNSRWRGDAAPVETLVVNTNLQDLCHCQSFHISQMPHRFETQANAHSFHNINSAHLRLYISKWANKRARKNRVACTSRTRPIKPKNIIRL